MADHIAARLHAPGPKRMLALDGGGTRGIVSIAFLAEIERKLQAELGRGDDFVLSDYFDLIGGTSVGSIVATLLALGWRVEKIRDTFETWAPNIFVTSGLGLISSRFDTRKLRGHIQSVVYDWPLSTDNLKTGLCIVTKRMDTGSVWPFVNNSAARYWHGRPPQGNNPARIANKDYKLLDIIHASAAAPSYFSPSKIRLFKGIDDGLGKGLFVDGGVSPHNNPSLQMLMLAGLGGYRMGGQEHLGWPLGADNLLLISVGTGSNDVLVQESVSVAWDGLNALMAMMADCQDLTLALMQWMSSPRLRWEIDREIGDLKGDRLSHAEAHANHHAILSFQRYDIRLERAWLSKTLGADMDDKKIESLRKFTEPKNMPELRKLAEKAAPMQVHASDFPAVFNQVWHPAIAPPPRPLESQLTLPVQEATDRFPT